MLRPLLIVVLLAAAATGAYWLSESRRLGGRVARLQERITRLEGELGAAFEQRDELLRLLERRVREEKEAREARRRAHERATRPLPEAVRRALVGVNRCLSEEGYDDLRFLTARAIDGRTLVDVELLDRDRDTMSSTMYFAGRVDLTLDRSRSVVVVRLREGEVVRDGERSALPADGELLEIAGIDGPLWEDQLGYLLARTGQYPREAGANAPRPGLDRRSQAAWLSRLDRLLDGAGTEVRYRVDRFRSLEKGAFTDVLLLGYDEGRRLAVAVEAARMTVTVDGDSVTLVLQDGLLRKGGGETTIPAAGYRILLPSVTAKEAMDAMLGMVVRR